MKWSELLSEHRLGDPIVIDADTESRYPRSEFEKDYRRIIASASFRRLQDKTQVFPLDKSDFVRTRLTHSYETASIAKTLGVMIESKILKNQTLASCPKSKRIDEKDADSIRHIPDVLACAGLLHDIGNPPFGHFGEEIIQKWFATNLRKITLVDGSKDKTLEEKLNAAHKADLICFDGNAQALRVLTKLHFQDSDCGLNLTSAVLNTLIKYPTPSDGVKHKGEAGYALSRKKMGYTDAERGNYLTIASDTGARDCRHPLAFVLEAADDIAYKTADIEDAFKKGLFTFDQLTNFIGCQRKYYKKHHSRIYSDKVDELFERLDSLRLAGEMNTKSNKKIDDPALYALQNWIPYAQEWLMYCAAYGFDYHYAYIMSGEYEHDLLYGTNHHCSMDILGDVMQEFIFPNREIVKLELGANTILSSLLNKFVEAVLFHDGKFISRESVEVKAYQKLYGLISQNYREAYRFAYRQYELELKGTDEDVDGMIYSGDMDDQLEAYDIYLRLLLAVDYISGMTDSYAKTLYQELCGVS